MTRDERFLKEAFPCESEYAPRLKRLQAGEPLAYLLGEWDFYDLTFTLTPDCLIPRPDTEHLAEYLIQNLPESATFCDLCTGSGCIAITVLKHRPDTRAVAVDLFAPTLEIARKNAVRHGVQSRLTLQQADVLSPKAVFSGDWVVSNPPYIPTQTVQTLEESVRAYEPLCALDGGADGLDFYRALLTCHFPRLQKEAKMVLEIGYDQGPDLRALATQICPRAEFSLHRDYGGRDRMVVLTRT